MPANRPKPEFLANALRGAATLHEAISVTVDSDEKAKAVGMLISRDFDNLGALLTYAIENLSEEI